ncbi:Uncharacterized protein SCF082_LOCUS18102, partial [Durusdinium trenchii]
PPMPAPPLQPQMLHVYLLLGVLLCFETSIAVTLWYHSAHRATLGLHPLALLLVGLLAGQESRKDHRLLLSMMLACLSGFLMFPSWNASDLSAEIHGMLLAMISQLLAVARWLFTDQVLAPLDQTTPSDRFSAAIVLSANLAVCAASGLLELTTVFDLPGYWDLLEVQVPWSVLQDICILGLCFAVKLVSYLNLARVASFPFMGIVPMISAAVGLRLSLQPKVATL